MLFYFLVTYNANICQTLMKTKAQSEKKALRDICSQTSTFEQPLFQAPGYEHSLQLERKMWSGLEEGEGFSCVGEQ